MWQISLHLYTLIHNCTPNISYKLSVFVQGYKNCPRGGGGGQKLQNSVHVGVEWPQTDRDFLNFSNDHLIKVTFLSSHALMEPVGAILQL